MHRLILSKSEFKTLRINGIDWSDFQKKNQEQLPDNSILVLGSGFHKIEYTKLRN